MAHEILEFMIKKLVKGEWKVEQRLNFVTPPPNSYAEALTPSVTVFGDRPFREIRKLK